MHFNGYKGTNFGTKVGINLILLQKYILKKIEISDSVTSKCSREQVENYTVDGVAIIA